MHPSPFSEWAFEGDLFQGKEEGDPFQGSRGYIFYIKNKLKSERFNDKKGL